jgi:CDP-diacylglycerol--glycerol-3-phosphate 3-phosphatidyltransferase
MLKNNNVINIPNGLSVLRIILSILLFIRWENSFMFFSIILLIGFTDIFDGYIARKFNQETIVGAWIDAIADFVFYISIVLYILIFELKIIKELKYFIIIIIIIKILSLIICLIKYKKLGFLHTLGNKITGITIFLGICFFALIKTTLMIKIGLCVSIIFSLEELLINIIGEKYEENIKGIYEIIRRK